MRSRRLWASAGALAVVVAVVVGGATTAIGKGSNGKSVLKIGWAQDPQTLNPFVGLDEETPYIVRFTVDAGSQRQGIGRKAVELVLAELRTRGHDEVEVSFVPAPNGAEGFWRRLGFEPTGRAVHGEPVFARSLGS